MHSFVVQSYVMHTHTYSHTHSTPTVPNIILDHELILTSNSSANISVMYADCVDDTSDFMAEINYWRDGSDVVSLPLEPLSTSVFVLSLDLCTGMRLEWRIVQELRLVTLCHWTVGNISSTYFLHFHCHTYCHTY